MHVDVMSLMVHGENELLHVHSMHQHVIVEGQCNPAQRFMEVAMVTRAPFALVCTNSSLQAGSAETGLQPRCASPMTILNRRN